MKEIETGETTPEQLFQMLDAQLAARRVQRANAGRNRAIILVTGILFIVIGAGVAFFVLDQMLEDLRHSDRLPASKQVHAGGK